MSIKLLPCLLRVIMLQALALLQVCGTGIKAQTGDLKITTYAESDGLSSSIIRCVMQDSRGMLWVGTPDGLNTYDGYSFNTLRKSSNNTNTIKGNFITQLTEDLVGDIWIGYLNDGVSRYNTATGVFQHYSLQDADTLRTKTGEITCLFVDRQNQVWAGVKNRGLYKLDKNSGNHVQYNLISAQQGPVSPAYNTVYDMVEDDSTGVYWLATHAGLYRFAPSDKTMSLLRNRPLKEDDNNTELFVSIRRERNTLWLGSWAGGISTYETDKKHWHNFMYAKSAPTNNIVSDLLLKPGTDSIFIVTNDKGPGYFDKKRKTFHFIYHAAPNISADFKSIYKDRASNIWIASDRGLIKIWNQSRKFVFHELPVKSSSNNDLYGVGHVYENDDFIFYGTWFADGLQIKNKHTGKLVVLPVDILPGEEKNMLIMDIKRDMKGCLWVLTRDYMYAFDEKSQKLKKRRQPPLYRKNRSNYFVALAEAGDGSLWIASLRNGIFVYDKERDSIIRHYTSDNRSSYIPTRHVSSLHRDDNNVMWVGGSGGFLGYQGKDGNIQQVSVGLRNAPVIGTIKSLTCTPDNQVWAGTDVGLLQFSAAEKKPVKMFTSEEGITSDIVNKVYTDKNGEVWCITETALCKLNPAKGTVSNYGLDEGLDQPSIGNNIHTLQDGVMMISASRGYFLFHPDSLNVPQQPAPIIITSFMTKGAHRFYGEDLGKYQKVMLDPSENHFSFEFASIDFNRTGKQRYAYMLEGLDKDWTATYSRYAAYANLSPGDYVFNVRAIGNSGQEFGTTVTLPIHVSGYIYNTGGFRIAAVLAILGIMYLVYTIRLRNQRRLFLLQTKAGMLEKEKAMIMYDNLKQQLNPHFLFNSLTSLSSLIRINQKMAGEFLDGLSKIYRYILNNREKELVSLADEVQFSETYIKLQKTRFENALQVNVNIREEYLDTKIAPVTMQNLLENAIKHNIVTEDEPLMIDIYTNEENQLVVKNNLNKKPFVETSNRQGLKSLQSLYSYFSERGIEIASTEQYFIVKVPLL
ncbi:MAG: histidine kinase [Chitinophagaceae bacterium]|nr:histidine kinase [Chitinophagaceae bacterium]MCW5929672.1 histidine kinase [Chitinophagaceae bacterium]